MDMLMSSLWGTSSVEGAMHPGQVFRRFLLVEKSIEAWYGQLSNTSLSALYGFLLGASLASVWNSRANISYISFLISPDYFLELGECTLPDINLHSCPLCNLFSFTYTRAASSLHFVV
ncbi:hypothetical protein ARMGADRAFT_89508 [Armillaria gallica]|uniref:Uncharacterized protein n=1 Tax=Armillaria gallica TaxID=47427 RepID=A0A2H3E3J2_ARMGA|nr:hypothetical protein ARMGADRAFT_89508 [Armillaria gallica]